MACCVRRILYCAVIDWLTDHACIVLPQDMIQFSNSPTPEALATAIDEAIPKVQHVQPQMFHQRVRKMYDWHDVARRTEIVYDKVRKEPCISFIERLRRYYGIGPMAGVLACILVAVMHLYYQYLEFVEPADTIEAALDINRTELIQMLDDGDSHSETDDS